MGWVGPTVLLRSRRGTGHGWDGRSAVLDVWRREAAIYGWRGGCQRDTGAVWWGRGRFGV